MVLPKSHDLPKKYNAQKELEKDTGFQSWRQKCGYAPRTSGPHTTRSKLRMNRLIGQVNRPVIVFIQRVHVPKIELYKTRYGMGGGQKFAFLALRNLRTLPTASYTFVFVRSDHFL